MKKQKIILGLIAMLATLWFLQTPVFASKERAAADVRLTEAMDRLGREASADADGPQRIASLIQREYGIPDEDIDWAASRLEWGQIAVFAYIHATIGRSFEELTRENASADFAGYVQSVGMNSDKMASSLESFTKRAERERNSRIFTELRASRRVHSLPDLGSGFGLFQEALDFRRIDSARPVKIHDEQGVRTKVQD